MIESTGAMCEGSASMSKALLRMALAVGTASALLWASAASAKDFTYDEKANQEMARRLKIPVYFAVPTSARAKLPNTVNTTDRLVDFKHPDAKGGDVGL